MYAWIRIASTDWQASKHTVCVGNPLLQVHPSFCLRAHGIIDSHCLALRTASCPTKPVFLSIGNPPSTVSNTGAPGMNRPAALSTGPHD
jgi:hypothetical protein